MSYKVRPTNSWEVALDHAADGFRLYRRPGRGEEVGGVAVDGQDAAVGVHGVDQVRGIFHQALIPGLGFLQLFLLAVHLFFQAGRKLLLITEIQHDDGARQDHQADDHLEVELPGIEGMDHPFHFAGRGHHRHRPGGCRLWFSWTRFWSSSLTGA